MVWLRRVCLVMTLSLAAAPAAWAECTDSASNDCDGDGFRASDGDCDDANPDVRPGAQDICNGFDDDCDGLEDENCVDTGRPTLQDAALGGGSSCPSGSAWLLLLPLMGLWRRK